MVTFVKKKLDFFYFTVTEILRETNFRESRSYKNVDFAIFKALNFVHLAISSLQKMQKIINFKFRANKFVRMVDFETLEWPILISRKI